MYASTAGRRLQVMVSLAFVLGSWAVGSCQMFQGGPEHTGVTAAAGPRQAPQVKWQFKTGGRIFSSPILSGGVLYIGSADGNLYALEAVTGHERWHFRTRGAVNATPAVVGGRVFFLSMDGYCYAVDTATGKQVWRFRTRGEKVHDAWDYYLSSPAVVNGMVYFGSGDGRVYALDARTGRRVWAFRTGGIVHAAPAVAGGVVYIGAFDGWFYALDAKTGRRVWQFKTVGDQWVPKGEIQGSASVANGTVLFGSRDFNLYALDATTGTGKWNDKVLGTWVVATPAVKGDMVYVGTSDGRSFLAYDLPHGQRKWTYPTALNVFSSAAIAGDVLYFGSFDGKLHAVDRTTGTGLWQWRTPTSIARHDTVLNEEDEPWPDLRVRYGNDYPKMYEAILQLGAILSSPAVENGVVYVGTCEGVVYALQ